MFKNTIKTLIAVGVIAAGATLSTAGSANAGSVGVYIGNGHGGVYFSDGHRRGGYHKAHKRNRVCTPRRALKKAWRLGVKRPYVDRIGRNRIVVKGFSHGHRAKVVYDRDRSRCPVIRTRGLY